MWMFQTLLWNFTADDQREANSIAAIQLQLQYSHAHRNIQSTL